LEINLQLLQWQEDREQDFGFSDPKGTLKMCFQNGEKYLFEIIADTLKRANKEYIVTIPWYIMTSKENNKKTVEFLEEKEYFGYKKDFVKIFTQEEIPFLNKEGKLIIDEDMKIKEAANGNGGIFSSMDKHRNTKRHEKKRSRVDIYWFCG